jgi:hypothetical protein
MPMFRTLFAWLACAALCTAAHAAQPVYKCRADGKVSYSDRPCPNGPSQTLPAPALQGDVGIPAGDTAGFGTGDARALLELEKQRTELARQQASAAREAAKQQAAMAREQRAAARTGRVQVKQVQHCDKLRLQQKWLEEDLAKAHTPAQQETLRTKVRRHGESMAVECPA